MRPKITGHKGHYFVQYPPVSDLGRQMGSPGMLVGPFKDKKEAGRWAKGKR